MPDAPNHEPQDAATSPGIVDAGFGAPGEIGDEAPPPVEKPIDSPNITAARDELGELDPDKPDLIDSLRFEGNELGVTNSLLSLYAERELGTKVDPDYVWRDQDFETIVSQYGPPQGLREDFLDFVGGAKSAEHANVLARRFMETVRQREELGKLSLGRRAAIMAAVIASDPVMVMTGGLAGAVRGVGRGAVAIGGLTAAEQSVVSLNNPVQDETEVFYAAAAGAALGSLGNLILGRLGGKEGAKFARETEDHLSKARDEAGDLSQEFAGGRAATLGRGEDLTTTPVAKAGDEVGAAAKADEKGSVGAAADAERGVDADRQPLLTAIADDVEVENGVVLKAPTPIPGARNIPLLRTAQDMGLNSKSGDVRAVTQKALREDVGATQASGQVTEVLAKSNEARILAETAKEYHGSFNAWVRRARKPNNTETQAEFYESVGKATRRGGSLDPDVSRAVLATQKAYARALPMGKRAGTFDAGVTSSDTFLNRIWNGSKMRAAIDTHGGAAINKLILVSLKSGLAKAGVKLAPELIERWAKNFSRSIRDQADGLDGAAFGIPIKDQAKLDELLVLQGVARKDIDAIKAELRFGAGGDGKISQAKPRAQLDETVGIPTRQGGLTLEDLLENDVRKILPTYAKRVGADAAMRETLGVAATEAGVEKLVREIRIASAQAGDRPAVADGLEAALRDIAGLRRKGLNPDGFWPRASSTMRNTAFMVFGPLFGTASLAEFGAVVGKLGILGTLKALPALRKFRRDAISGKLDLEFVDHVEAYTGLGLDRIMRPRALRGTKFDAAKEELVNVRTGVERAAVSGRNAVVKYSGLEWVTEWQRQQTPILILSEFERVLMRGGKMKGAVQKRMAQMGYDAKALTALSKDLNRFGVDIAGSVRNIRRADLDEWALKSPKTHARFMQALLREGERTIIETSAGRTPIWMQSGWGQVIGQFMGFTVNSYNTHLLRGLSMADHQFMMNLMTSTIITTAAGVAISSARYANDPKKLEEKLSIAGMAKWGVARNTFLGIPTMAVDSLLGLSGRDGFFNSRYSNLDSTPGVDSSPSIALMGRLFGIGKRMAAIAQGQKPLTGDDFAALINVTPLSVVPSVKKAAKEGAADLFNIPLKDPRN